MGHPLKLSRSTISHSCWSENQIYLLTSLLLLANIVINMCYKEFVKNVVFWNYYPHLVQVILSFEIVSVCKLFQYGLCTNWAINVHPNNCCKWGLILQMHPYWGPKPKIDFPPIMQVFFILFYFRNWIEVHCICIAAIVLRSYQKPTQWIEF